MRIAKQSQQIIQNPYFHCMKTILTSFLIFFSLLSCAQNINGIWSGSIYSLDKKGKEIFRFPIALDIRFDSLSNQITGYSRTHSFDTVFAECKIKGEFNRKKDFFDIWESETISTNIPMEKPSSILNRFKVNLDSVSKPEKITGKCSCRGRDADFFLCGEKMKIELERYPPAAKETGVKKE
jgi:hypothetical protein